MSAFAPSCRSAEAKPLRPRAVSIRNTVLETSEFLHTRLYRFPTTRRFPGKFPEIAFFSSSQISRGISGNLDQGQITTEADAPAQLRKERASRRRRYRPT